MLPAQVSYWELQESIRHNKEVERANFLNAETNRIDAITRNYVAKEQARHNRVVEEVSWYTIYETERHNKQQERLGFETLRETTRHNLATENLAQQEINEAARHNRESERIGWGNVAAAQRSAAAAVMSAQAAQSQAAAAHKQAAVAQQRANTDRWIAANNIAAAQSKIRLNTAQTANYRADTAQEYSKANYYDARAEYQWKENDWYILNKLLPAATGIAKSVSSMF